MNKLTLPSGDVTIEQAAWLLADAKHPGADKKTRFHNFRWMLNGLLAAVSSGTLRGRIPATGEGIGPEGICVGDYVRIMVLTPSDIKKLAAERDIECNEPQATAHEPAAAGTGKAEPLGTATEPQATGTRNHQARKQRRDLLTPAIEIAQAEAKDATDTAEVFGILRNMAEARKPPFIGVTDSGLKWRDASDEFNELSIDALRKRINRRTAKRR